MVKTDCAFGLSGCERGSSIRKVMFKCERPSEYECSKKEYTLALVCSFHKDFLVREGWSFVASPNKE